MDEKADKTEQAEEEQLLFDEIKDVLDAQKVVARNLKNLEDVPPEELGNADKDAAQLFMRTLALADENEDKANKLAMKVNGLVDRISENPEEGFERKRKLLTQCIGRLGEFYRVEIGIDDDIAVRCREIEKLTKKPRRRRLRNTGLTFTKDKLTATVFNTYKNKAPLTPADWVNEETVPVDNGKAKSTTKLDISTGQVSEDEMERVTSYFLPSERIWLDMLNSIVHDGITDFNADDILARAGIKKPKRAAKEKREAYKTVLKLWSSYVAAETTPKDRKAGKFGNCITITPTRMLDADIPVTFEKDDNGEATNEVVDFEIHLNLQPGDKPSRALPLLAYAETTKGLVPADGKWFDPHKSVSMDWRRIANHLYRHAASNVKHPDRCNVETVMAATGITPWNPKPSTSKEKAALRDKRRKTQRNIESVLKHWQGFGGIESWERIEESGSVTGYRWSGFAEAHEKRVVEIDAGEGEKASEPTKS